jgi:putative transposase
LQIELDRSSHSVGRNLWTLEWCTKYRYKMMGKLENRNIVAACVRQAAFRHSIGIIEMSVMPDHIHMVASLPKGMDDIKAVKLLKGASSRKLFQVKEKHALRYPRHHFWSRGYYSHTVGMTDLQTQIDYVKNQEAHHGLLLLN